MIFDMSGKRIKKGKRMGLMQMHQRGCDFIERTATGAKKRRKK